MSKEHTEPQKLQKNDCGCGSSQVLKPRRLQAASATTWGKNQKSIKSKFLR